MVVNSSTIDKNIDIVCMSLSRWDAAISSPSVSIAKEFAKTNRVFFITHPYTWKDVVAGNAKDNPRQKLAENNIVVIDPPVVLPVNFLPAGALYNFFWRINQRTLYKTLRNILRENNVSEYIFINFFDPYFLAEIPPDIRPLRYVYQCMDDMSQVAYTRRHGVQLENEIIRRADLVLCTSRELTRLKSQISDNVRFHPNAADYELFHTAATKTLKRPADLDFGSKKIIGFTGSVEYRSDFMLLKKIASRHPDKILFFVGPVQGTEYIAAGLTEMPNVVFAGPRHISELPAYLQYFDCCIIPYKRNVLTASIYPLKVNEYLAAGKPVVATPFSDDIRSFSDVLYLADTHEEFCELINKAMAEDDENKKAARYKAAASNTWSERIRQFWEFLT